jgi:hypothetical protein
MARHLALGEWPCYQHTQLYPCGMKDTGQEQPRFADQPPAPLPAPQRPEGRQVPGESVAAVDSSTQPHSHADCSCLPVPPHLSPGTRQCLANPYW